MMLARLFLLPTFALNALGHGGVWFYEIAGKRYDGYRNSNHINYTQDTIQRKWASDDPLQYPEHPLMACNDNGLPTIGSYHAEVPAGTTIDAHYETVYNTSWPHQAACPGPCHEWNADLKTVKWFKIFEAGLLDGNAVNGTWGSTLLYNGGPLTAKIPTFLKPGYYLIRHEIIANHMLSKQFYPECAQVKVTGNGTKMPEEEYLVTFPGAYSNNDPGLGNGTDGGAYWATLWDNATATYYPMQGPKLWRG